MLTPLWTISIRSLLVLLTVAASSGAGCSQQAPQVSIEGQYANLSPMLLGVGSVFMRINNAGGKDALIVAGVNIPDAVVELHDSRNGRMEKTGRIAIPSHGTVDLKPKGLHIMIFNMPKSIKDGSEISLMLRFEKSGERKVPVTFVKPGAVQAHDH